MKQTTLFYILCAIVTIIIGLGARACSSFLPSVVNLYLGDALWAMMMYWFLRSILLNQSVIQVMLLAYIICCLVECSQLYQADWINHIRSYRLGRLVLGRGFLWSDFLAYVLGILGAGWIDYKQKKAIL